MHPLLGTSVVAPDHPRWPSHALEPMMGRVCFGTPAGEANQRFAERVNTAFLVSIGSARRNTRSPTPLGGGRVLQRGTETGHEPPRRNPEADESRPCYAGAKGGRMDESQRRRVCQLIAGIVV